MQELLEHPSLENDNDYECIENDISMYHGVFNVLCLIYAGEMRKATEELKILTQKYSYNSPNTTSGLCVYVMCVFLFVTLKKK